MVVYVKVCRKKVPIGCANQTEFAGTFRGRAEVRQSCQRQNKRKSWEKNRILNHVASEYLFIASIAYIHITCYYL